MFYFVGKAVRVMGGRVVRKNPHFWGARGRCGGPSSVSRAISVIK